jgi:hypothetical protein
VNSRGKEIPSVRDQAPNRGAEEKAGSLRSGWRVCDYRKKAVGGRGI